MDFNWFERLAIIRTLFCKVVIMRNGSSSQRLPVAPETFLYTTGWALDRCCSMLVRKSRIFMSMPYPFSFPQNPDS